MSDRSRIWLAVFVLVVFATGLAAGVLLDRTLWRGPQFVDRGPGRPGAALRLEARPLADRMATDLKLTDDQRRKLEALFDQRRVHLQDVQRELRGRFEKEQEEFRAEVRKILTPDQATQFEDMMRRGPGRRRRGPRGMGDRFGPPPPTGPPTP